MTSDSEDWEQLQALFHLAGETPDAEVEALLAGACADPQLRQRAFELIVAARIEPGQQDAGATPATSDRIGPYTIVRHLGSGGIGSVYLAERLMGGTVQRTALKMLARHAAGSFFVDRFLREQHILGSLEHPNITRMLDAGLTVDGQPYLVMEYVDGVHIDLYCDSHELGVDERVQLFLRVCDAVAYAHRNLIVHLDLKPSNILVAGSEGTVKLLDFGTSKLIKPDSLLTTTVMATPAYASPEQLLNEGVTTACDVYALGAVLFELLSGRRPNQDSSVAIMIERSLRELPPESLPEAVTPSAAAARGTTETRLRNHLTGDLETIVAKCLTPRPRDRYASVDALVTDLERYRSGRPIFARPQTTTYRISKFVRRNRNSVVAASLALLLIVFSISYAVWRQEQALRAGQRALQMQTFMAELFKLANTSYMGKPAATVPELLQLGVKVLPDLIHDPADQRAALMSLARSMYEDSDYPDAQPVFAHVIASAKSSGDLASEAEAEAYAGKIAFQLGETDRGEVLAAHALSLIHAPGVTPSVRIYIETFYAQNRENEGFRTDQNLSLMQAALDESRSQHVPENQLAYVELNLAQLLGPRGHFPDEDRLTQEAINIYAREPYAVCDQADANEELALVHNQVKDWAGSLALITKAYEGYKRCAGEDSLKALEVQGYMAAAMLRMNQVKQVIPMLEASLPKWIKLSGPDSDELATPLLFLAKAYVLDHQYEKAETTASNLVRVEAGKINPLSAQMGVCQTAWAQALAGQHKDREALVHAELADTAFAAEGSKSPGTQNNALQAHQLLLGLRARAAIPAAERQGGAAQK